MWTVTSVVSSVGQYWDSFVEQRYTARRMQTVKSILDDQQLHLYNMEYKPLNTHTVAEYYFKHAFHQKIKHLPNRLLCRCIHLILWLDSYFVFGTSYACGGYLVLF
jgi:hypothetical protein